MNQSNSVTMPASPRYHEVVPPADLSAVYRALLMDESGLCLKALQAAVADYDQDRPGSGAAFEHELSKLSGKPVRLSAVQLACFKEILVGNPVYASISPWVSPDCVW